MADYSAHIRFDSGDAVVQTSTNTFRVAGCDVNCDQHSCPTELIIGALGS